MSYASDPRSYRSPSPSLQSTEGSPGYEAGDIKKYREAYYDASKEFGYDFNTFSDTADYTVARQIVNSLKGKTPLGKTPSMYFGFPEDAAFYVSALTGVYYQEIARRGEAVGKKCLDVMNPKHQDYKEANIKNAIAAELEYQKNMKGARTCKRVFLELYDIYWKIIKGMKERTDAKKPAEKERIKNIIIKSSSGNLLPLHVKDSGLYSYISRWSAGGSRRRSRKAAKKATRKARKAHKKTRGRRRH
jgi:hypothetical protein